MKNIKKTLYPMIFFFIAACIINIGFGSNLSCVHATTVTPKLSKKKATVSVGKTATIKVKKIKRIVKVASSKKAVATVKKSGKKIVVTGKKAGTSVITVKVKTLKNKTKTLKCKITVKQYYGKVSGNITYHYNQYRGYVADTNAKVFLIPMDGSAKKYSIPEEDLSILNNVSLVSKHIYTAKVDGAGNYIFNRIPVGKYRMVVISNNCKSAEYFNSSSEASYYQTLASRLGIKKYLSSSTALHLAEASLFYETYATSVTVYKNETSTISYAFPYTYI